MYIVYVYICMYSGVCMCILVHVRGCAHMCMRVYCGVYTCTRVCLCEFMCLVACCSVSDPFGEIWTVAGDLDSIRIRSRCEPDT